MTVTKAQEERKSVEWATPLTVFNALNQRFGFTLDPASTDENAKCEKHFTKEQNGLLQSWAGERVWLNPPYGKELPTWIDKARYEIEHGCPLIVAIFPPRSDTVWWHRNIPIAAEVWNVKGRVHFVNPDNAADRPQDPSCIVVFDSSRRSERALKFWDWKADTFL